MFIRLAQSRQGVASSLLNVQYIHIPQLTCLIVLSFPRWSVKTSKDVNRIKLRKEKEKKKKKDIWRVHADALALSLLQRLQGLLNQAIIAHEDAEGYCHVSTIGTSCRVGLPRAPLKTSRPAMLSCSRVNNRLWPSKPSLLKHLEGCMLMRWSCCRGLKKLRLLATRA
eukprot:jgi/Botrbrau1/1845/Bobra.146_1s0039.1